MTALIYSEEFMKHDPGRSHPENPWRLRAIVETLKKEKMWYSPEVQVTPPSPASVEDLQLVHDPSYVRLVEKMSESGTPLDLDTPTPPGTFGIALLAVGGAIDAGEGVVSGKWNNAFALLRPPGHHACRVRGGGFCYFNNVAVMVEKLKRNFNMKRIMILDLDAHHGNGTQDIFYEDPSVLYLSFHQDPRTLYPGCGFIHELGSGDGEGFNVNVPFPPGSGDPDYAFAIEEIFLPLSEIFKPEFIAVSVGFDPLAEDPLTQLQLSPSAYGWLTGHVVKQAEHLCGGKVVFVLEGGYALEVIGEAAANLTKALVGREFASPPEHRRLPVIGELKRLLAKYWSM